jgi:hypothetical protein
MPGIWFLPGFRRTLVQSSCLTRASVAPGSRPSCHAGCGAASRCVWGGLEPAGICIHVLCTSILQQTRCQGPSCQQQQGSQDVKWMMMHLHCHMHTRMTVCVLAVWVVAYLLRVTATLVRPWCPSSPSLRQWPWTHLSLTHHPRYLQCSSRAHVRSSRWSTTRAGVRWMWTSSVMAGVTASGEPMGVLLMCSLPRTRTTRGSGGYSQSRPSTCPSSLLSSSSGRLRVPSEPLPGLQVVRWTQVVAEHGRRRVQE